MKNSKKIKWLIPITLSVLMLIGLVLCLVAEGYFDLLGLIFIWLPVLVCLKYLIVKDT